MRKLVTYWTIFSFISLFEHVFEKLIEWIPLWPYIKLIAICWLVIPEFNGACYFYQNLVHPCFPLKLHDVIAQFYGCCYVCQRFAYLCSFVNLQTFTDWFNKPMEDPSLQNETFWDVAEMYLEENGSDPLVKLIASKTACEGSGPVWEDIKVMIAKHEVAVPKQVESVKENQIQLEKKTVGMRVEEMIVPADVEEIKLPEITSVKQVQTEWTCAVCQVTTTSEHNLKSHLNGGKHKAKCEELKTCKQVAKSEGISPVTTKSSQLNQAQVKHAAAAQSEHSTNEAAEPKQVKSVKEKLVQIKETAFPADNTKEIKLRETNSLKNVQKEWTCAVCQVTTTSEHDLKCHLLGRKHREKCEELKACKKKAKTERNPPDQLKKEQVKHAHSAQITRSAYEKPKEKVQLGATRQHEKQKQVKNAVGVTNNSKLWCRFCNVRCPGEIDMAAHLKGRKHLAKLQETMV